MVKSGLKIIDDLMLRETLAPLISSEKGRLISFGVLAVAGILLFTAVINAFSTWHADLTLARQLPSVATSSSVSESGLIASIPSQHIFGLSAHDNGDFLPVTSLQLALTGVIKNSNNNLSKAIISTAGQPGKVYAVGEEVATGIKINAINADGIVLEHAGQFEKLPLARSALTFNDKPKAIWKM